MVTGATGFLGGAVARPLVREGYRVRALGRDRAALAALAACGMDARAVALDDGAAMGDACADAHAIVHAGALSSPWGAAADFYRANVVGTSRLFGAARARAAPNARVVYVSSPSVYFRYADQLDVREDTPFPDVTPSPYVATKREAEQLARAEAQEGGNVITLRPRAIFGPGDSSLLPRLLRAASTKRLRVIGDGNTIADLTYIDNVVDAVLLALQASADYAGRCYNITNGEPIRLWDVIATMCAAYGAPLQAGAIPRSFAMAVARGMEATSRTGLTRREPLLTRYSVAVLSYSQTLSIAAAMRDLGYHPRVGMADAITRTVPTPQR